MPIDALIAPSNILQEQFLSLDGITANNVAWLEQGSMGGQLTGLDSSETAVLENLFGLAKRVAEQRESSDFTLPLPIEPEAIKYPDSYTFPTEPLGQDFKLEQEFQLAVYDQAKYHYRRILSVETGGTETSGASMVKAYLGTLLAKTSRLEEATRWMSSALADFLIEFTTKDLDDNAVLYHKIECLYNELFEERDGPDENWAPLSSCMRQISNTIRNAISGGNCQVIFPQLLIDGLAFAGECIVLPDFESAKVMYQALLRRSQKLDPANHGTEIAAAHHTYALLLRNEALWVSSAEHFLFACDLAKKARPLDNELLASLRRDAISLLPFYAGHLATEILAERIRETLIPSELQDASTEQTATDVVLSRVEDYLSSDLPVHFATPKSLSTSDIIRSVISSRERNRVHDNRDHLSCTSPPASTSDGGGRRVKMKTYSNTLLPDIDDRLWLKPVANSWNGSDIMSIG